MAYAALLSLSNTIDSILSYNQDAISSPAKDQIISIAESAVLMQSFTENFPEEARRFEAIIRAVTHAAEDIIEVFVSCHVYEPRLHRSGHRWCRMETLLTEPKVWRYLSVSQGNESFSLTNLQALSLAINFACTPDIAKAIPNVKKLAILYMHRDDEEDYQLSNLTLLLKLENLNIEIHPRFPCVQKIKPTFPPTLAKLTLTGFKLPWEDLRNVGLLPNLQVLKLKSLACSGGTWETTEGEFPQLKLLLIDRTDLENWITESSHFPQLKYLWIYRCPYLNLIPDDIGEIPTLELIEVEHHRESLVESVRQIQVNQQECGNYSLRVCIVKALPIPNGTTW